MPEGEGKKTLKKRRRRKKKGAEDRALMKLEPDALAAEACFLASEYLGASSESERVRREKMKERTKRREAKRQADAVSLVSTLSINGELEREVALLREENHSLHRDLAALEDHETALRDLEEIIAAKNSQSTSMGKRLETLQSELEAEKRTSSRLREDLAKMATSHAESTQHAAMVKTAAVDSMDELQTLREHKEYSAKQLSSLEGEVQELMRENKNLTRKCCEACRLLEIEKASSKKYASEAKAARINASRLADEIERMKQEFSTIEYELASEKRSSARYKRLLEEKKKDIYNVRAAHSEALGEMEIELANAEAKLGR